MQKEIQNSISACVGSLCEVLTLENSLLFVGPLQRYNPANDEITIELYKDAIPPRVSTFRDMVKVQLHRSANKEMVQVFFGVISGTTDRIWKIQLEKAVLHSETRQNFRQRVNCNAVIARVWNETYRGPEHFCTLSDISLGGLSFRSDLTFFLRERLLFSDVCLRPEGHIYNFRCIVRRIQQDHRDPQIHLYGCQFLQLSPQDETLLCQDIFAMQSDELNRWRNVK